MDKGVILKLLSDFIAIQSVSAHQERKSQIQKAASFLSSELEKLKFEVRLLKNGDAPPLILGTHYLSHDRGIDNSKTIGIYGHYDVQPEDPVGEWKTQPFRLTTKSGKLYGRGVADNKGHVIQNLTSIKRLIEVNKLKNNIIFILEGEEETGSVNFENYVSEAKEILSKVDVFYLTDVGMFRRNIPQIFYALRGLVYFELSLETGSRDLHSGIWGNRVSNPVQIAAHLFAKMKDEKTGKILIPGFYDNVRKIPEKERSLLRDVARSDAQQLKDAGVYELVSLDKKQPYLSTKIYPSLDINGFISGYGEDGAKTVIPRKAIIKFSCRLVERQNPDKIEISVKNFVRNNLPKGVKYNLRVLSKNYPFYTDLNNPLVKKSAAILTRHFGNKSLFNRSGGSIPAAEILQRRFKKPIILTGFTLPDDNIHSPNENFDAEMFWKGIGALEKIYSQ